MKQMYKDDAKSSSTALAVLQVVIAAALFFIDIYMGPGVADGVGYSIVLVLCLWNPKHSYALAWSAIITVLILAGGIIVPDKNLLHAESFDRALEICTVWVLWFLIRAIAPTYKD